MAGYFLDRPPYLGTYHGRQTMGGLAPGKAKKQEDSPPERGGSFDQLVRRGFIQQLLEI